jgi:hypothetical protein
MGDRSLSAASFSDFPLGVYDRFTQEGAIVKMK